MRIIDFFIDPLLRAPMWGAMLISTTLSCIGVFVFVQRRSLVGEVLAHATYPGVMAAALLALFLGFSTIKMIFLLIGAILAAFLALWLMEQMMRKTPCSADAAMTFVLASFFGIGITTASFIQTLQPLFFQNVRIFLYGQSATLSDHHILTYAVYLLLVVTLIVLFYKEFKILLFDPSFAKLLLGRYSLWDFTILLMILSALVLALPTVGVLLISGMLIGPALAARQFTHSLSKMFILSALFGATSAALGNLFSFYLSELYGLSLPTGPSIVIVAQTIALFSLLFAPERGFFIRCIRRSLFSFKCREENLLKFLWAQSGPLQLTVEICQRVGTSRLILKGILVHLKIKGWVHEGQEGYTLTARGQRKGANIVRLHRLWELYLVKDFYMSQDRVHQSAEEIEHILTPELEKHLTNFLSHPLSDPHDRPIPSNGEYSSDG